MKRVLFTAILVVILVASIEIVSSLYYFLGVTQQSREMLEPLLGVTGPGAADLLRYAPHPYFNYVFNRDYRYADGFKPYNANGFRAPEWTKKRPRDDPGRRRGRQHDLRHLLPGREKHLAGVSRETA